MHQRPGTLEIVDADEVKLMEVSKHSFGILRIYMLAAFGMTIAVALAYFLIPSVINDTAKAFSYATLFAIVSVFFVFISLLVSTVIFRQNRIIVTDRNITQVLQNGIFSRKVSQLNIVNVEDVTSVQKGFISTLLNFGTLKIETAGEQSNFYFSYCPNSNYCAKVILDARERMLGQADKAEAGSAMSQKMVGELTGMRAKSSPVKQQSKAKVHQGSNVKEDIRSLGAEVLEHTQE